MDKAESEYGWKLMATQGRKCLVNWHKDISRMIPLVVSEALDTSGLGLVIPSLWVVKWIFLLNWVFLMLVRRACVIHVPLISAVI